MTRLLLPVLHYYNKSIAVFLLLSVGTLIAAFYFDGINSTSLFINCCSYSFIFSLAMGATAEKEGWLRRHMAVPVGRAEIMVTRLMFILLLQGFALIVWFAYLPFDIYAGSFTEQSLWLTLSLNGVVLSAIAVLLINYDLGRWKNKKARTAFWLAFWALFLTIVLIFAEDPSQLFRRGFVSMDGERVAAFFQSVDGALFFSGWAFVLLFAAIGVFKRRETYLR